MLNVLPMASKNVLVASDVGAPVNSPRAVTPDVALAAHSPKGPHSARDLLTHSTPPGS